MSEPRFFGFEGFRGIGFIVDLRGHGLLGRGDTNQGQAVSY